MNDVTRLEVVAKYQLSPGRAGLQMRSKPRGNELLSFVTTF